MRQGPKWHDYDLVVTGLVPGRPLSGEVLSRRLALLCEQAGLPRLTFHHLRHLCATMLTMRGVPPRVVQGILGHSTPDLAMRVYSHVQASALASAAEAMDEALGRRSGS